MEQIILSAFADEYASGFEEQLKALKNFGISHIEVRHVDGKNISVLTKEEVLSAKAKLEEYGIFVSAIGSPIGKIALDGDIDGHFEMAKRVFEYANILGAKYIRMFSFYPAEEENIADKQEEVFALLARLVQLADEYNVILCHENEAKIYGDTPARCLEILNHFDGKIQCVFDMGNFVLENVNPLDGYELLKGHIAYFHIKDALYAGAIVPPGKGEANIQEILFAHKEWKKTEFFATLEPHLQLFGGLNALVGREFENPYQYEDEKSAFSDAVEKIKELLTIKTFQKDLLSVNVYPTRKAMGEAAAKDVKKKIISLLEEKESINMIFAAAPSQNEVLAALANDKEIPWERVNAFHMDEYVGLNPTAPQGFGNFLKEHIFGIAPFKSVHYINIAAVDAQAECNRYAKILQDNPTDIVVLGIGENGHIAFNDPPVADFQDEQWVKTVQLDEICRNQQVNDGCFATLADVPSTAITLTVPTLFKGKYLFCIVPAKTKANAVYATINSEIGEHCPATILRRHQNATLYLDGDSSSLL